MVSSTVIATNNIPPSDNSQYKIDLKIYTDKEVYSIGELIKIKGFIKFDFIFSGAMKYLTMNVSIIDWSDGSIILLFEDIIEVTTGMPIYLNKIDHVNNLQWVCNKTGEFGVKIHLKENTGTNPIDISFVDTRFLVIKDRMFVDIYTDYLIYSESQNINIYGLLIPNLNYSNADIEINIKKEAKLIQKIYYSKHDLFIDKKIYLNCSFNNSVNIEGPLTIYLYINFNDSKTVKNIVKTTKIYIKNKSTPDLLLSKLGSKQDILKQYPELFNTLSDTTYPLYDFSDQDIKLIKTIIDGYHELNISEKTSLFFFPSNGNKYMTTGDLIYWLITDFAEKTQLEKDDVHIFLSYAAVFDDFFIRNLPNNIYLNTYSWDEKKDEEIEWIKEYMINQCNFFTVKTLQDVTTEYGIAGLMHVIYPNLDEHFGDLYHQFIPIEAYEKIKRFTETTIYDNLSLEEILTAYNSTDSLNQTQSYIWSNILSERRYTNTKPTTVGFTEYVISNILNKEKFPGNCITVSRLTTLMGRSIATPVGIIRTSGKRGHWGNFQIFEGKIILDSQVQNIFNQDKSSSKEKYIISWPSLHNFSSYGYGTDQWYRKKFGEQLPEFYSEMDLEVFLKVISIELKA
jgi:hypothetical protein